MRRTLLAGLFLSTACVSESAVDFGAADRTVIEDSIRSLLELEVAAFAAGDCETAVSVYADRRPLFVVSGRTMADRAALTAACPRLVAARPPGARRTIVEEVVHVLGPDAAYSVTQFALPAPAAGATATVPQFVSKVWSRDNGEWRITHVHESVGGGGPGGGPPGGAGAPRGPGR